MTKSPSLGKLLAEIMQVACFQPPLQKCAGIDARRGMSLKVDLVGRTIPVGPGKSG